MPVVASAISRPSCAGRGQLDNVAVLLQESPQRASEPRVVLDDEQVHGGMLRRRVWESSGRRAGASAGRAIAAGARCVAS